MFLHTGFCANFEMKVTFILFGKHGDIFLSHVRNILVFGYYKSSCYLYLALLPSAFFAVQLFLSFNDIGLSHVIHNGVVWNPSALKSTLPQNDEPQIYKYVCVCI